MLLQVLRLSTKHSAPDSLDGRVSITRPRRTADPEIGGNQISFVVAGSIPTVGTLAPVRDNKVTILGHVPVFADKFANFAKIRKLASGPHIKVKGQGGGVECPQRFGKKTGRSGGTTFAKEPRHRGIFISNRNHIRL